MLLNGFMHLMLVLYFIVLTRVCVCSLCLVQNSNIFIAGMHGEAGVRRVQVLHLRDFVGKILAILKSKIQFSISMCKCSRLSVDR